MDDANRCTSSSARSAASGPSVPGTTGTPAACAAVRDAVFPPISAMTSADGPTKRSPASRQARAKSAFSARNP